MTPDAHLTYDLAMAMAYTSKLVERHTKITEVVAEVATILGAAQETGGLLPCGQMDEDRIILLQAGIITSTVKAWTPLGLPQLEQARSILRWAEDQSPGRAPLFVDANPTEGDRLGKALAAAIGNLARSAGALCAVLCEVELSRFKEFFDVDRLNDIGRAAGLLTATITPLRIPDLSNPEL